MKRSNSKFRSTPKFQAGGFMGSFGKSMNMLGSAAPNKGYTDEESFNLQTYGQNIMKRQQNSDQTGQQVENAVGSLGPWGAAIAGVSKLAGKAFGPDAYGDYKEGAGGTTKEFFNRSLNMKEGVAGLMDTFKRPTAGNIKSQLSLGLWGKSEREKDAEQFKKDVQIRKTNDMLTQNAQLGSAVKSALPKFQAPAYGQHGMKLGTPKDVKLPSDFKNVADYDKWYLQNYGQSQYRQTRIPESLPMGKPDLSNPLKLNQFRTPAFSKPKTTQTPELNFLDVVKMAPAQFSEAWKDLTSMSKGGKMKFKSKFNRA